MRWDREHRGRKISADGRKPHVILWDMLSSRHLEDILIDISRRLMKIWVWSSLYKLYNFFNIIHCIYLYNKYKIYYINLDIQILEPPKYRLSMNLVVMMVLVTKSCLTFATPCSLPGSSVHEISQARILEWVAISFAIRSSELKDRTQASCIAAGWFFRTKESQANLPFGKKLSKDSSLEDNGESGSVLRIAGEGKRKNACHRTQV